MNTIFIGKQFLNNRAAELFGCENFRGKNDNK